MRWVKNVKRMSVTRTRSTSLIKSKTSTLIRSSLPRLSLRIADIHFEREDFIEAQNGYQYFKELHPTHPRIDYVTYQLGMSFFNQLPSTIDRDLQLAQKAILYFDEVTTSHSTSSYAAKAKEYKEKAVKMLAEKENYIAHFYFICDKYGSALGRYEEIIKTYPIRA